jgi:hypothetical protein
LAKDHNILNFVNKGTNSDTEMVRGPGFMMGMTMTVFWYDISGGIQSEDTFYVGVQASNRRIFFSIIRFEFSLLYVVRWTIWTK